MRPGVAFLANRNDAPVAALAPWSPALEDVVKVRERVAADDAPGLLAVVGDSLKVTFAR